MSKITNFVTKLAYGLGCLIFLVSALNPLQLAGVGAVAMILAVHHLSILIGVYLSNLYLWFWGQAIRYGFPFAVLVMASVTNPLPNPTFYWDVALVNGIRYAFILACIYQLLSLVLTLTHMVFVILPMSIGRMFLSLACTVADAVSLPLSAAIYRLAKRAPTHSYDEDSYEVSPNMAFSARSLMVGDFPSSFGYYELDDKINYESDYYHY